MSKNKNRALAATFLAAILGLCSCKIGQKKASLKIVNWNAQTFFDANKDGIEYSNFLKSKKWDEAAYKESARAAAIKMRDDIVKYLLVI